MTDDRRCEGEDVFETVALLTNGDNNCDANNIDSAVWSKYQKQSCKHYIVFFKHNAKHEIQNINYLLQ